MLHVAKARGVVIDTDARQVGRPGPGATKATGPSHGPRGPCPRTAEGVPGVAKAVDKNGNFLGEICGIFGRLCWRFLVIAIVFIVVVGCLSLVLFDWDHRPLIDAHQD